MEQQPTHTPTPPPISKKNQHIGVCLLLAPFFMLILVLVSYALVNFFLSNIALPRTTPPATYDLSPISQESITTARPVVYIVRMILTLVGMLSVMSIFITMPLGVYFLVKKDRPQTPTPEHSEPTQT